MRGNAWKTYNPKPLRDLRLAIGQLPVGGGEDGKSRCKSEEEEHEDDVGSKSKDKKYDA